MGGYETLPNPVPAADMVYEFVSRALLGGYNGISVKDVDIPEGGDKTFYFSYTVPEDYNVEQMQVTLQ